jgi:hypothetical protein
MGMAVTLGTIGTAIAGFAVTEDETGATKGVISQGTIELMTMLMLPLSIAIISYAIYTFYMRSEFIRKKQASMYMWLYSAKWARLGLVVFMSLFGRVHHPSPCQPVPPCRLAHTSPLDVIYMQIGFFDDHVGPMVVAIIVMFMLIAILVSAMRDIILAVE